MNLANLCWLIFGAAGSSFLVAWATTWLIRSKADGWGLVDHPGDRKVHLSPTPLGGGIGIWAGVVLPVSVGLGLLWLATGGDEEVTGGLARLFPSIVHRHQGGVLQETPNLLVLLTGATVMGIVGLIDDRRGLPWQGRMAIQIAVAAFCVSWKDWGLTIFTNLPILTWLISVMWIVVLINSFNMLDNMDGLSAGVATIASAMLAAVLLMNPEPDAIEPQLFVAGLLLVLCGALLGFLVHNRPPARIFMGDAGSYFVGFLIALATMLATFTSYHKSATQHALLAPICVMAVPLYDTATVVWIRLREGRSPFQGDKCHFSHRLVELGLTKGQAVLTIYLTTATCGLAALLLPRVDLIGAVIIVLLVLCVLSLIAILESTARRKLRS